ncbi:MAG: hypothetical protein E4H07_09470 [Nitrosomonadales bacterium]|nr:MAG: hypothetical protein E4H07_09470 [Nitrosomonadales bacterium]
MNGDVSSSDLDEVDYKLLWRLRHAKRKIIAKDVLFQRFLVGISPVLAKAFDVRKIDVDDVLTDVYGTLNSVEKRAMTALITWPGNKAYWDFVKIVTVPLSRAFIMDRIDIRKGLDVYFEGLPKSKSEADCDMWRKGLSPRTGRAYSRTQKTYSTYANMSGKCEPCDTFKAWPTSNPRTGRKISQRGKIYKDLVRECGSPRRLGRSASKSRRKSRSRSKSMPRSRSRGRAFFSARSSDLPKLPKYLWCHAICELGSGTRPDSLTIIDPRWEPRKASFD